MIRISLERIEFAICVCVCDGGHSALRVQETTSVKNLKLYDKGGELWTAAVLIDRRCVVGQISKDQVMYTIRKFTLHFVTTGCHE